ncbi:hypothetical protein HDF13_003236 [Edaphobacter lichenicola]|uniref:Uncharacterized protein n=1 Tax=Tunturiibacter gelidiferens TaxID=3069689 RepID=A0ACC5P267_9BACT|nr:hypothetical protein [Edaphobacter lichenicola]
MHLDWEELEVWGRLRQRLEMLRERVYWSQLVALGRNCRIQREPRKVKQGGNACFFVRPNLIKFEVKTKAIFIRATKQVGNAQYSTKVAANSFIGATERRGYIPGVAILIHLWSTWKED